MCGGREGEIGLDWMGGVGVEEQGAHVGCTYPGWGCGAQNCVHELGLRRVSLWGVSVHRAGCTHMGVSCEARSANQPYLPLPNMQLRLDISTWQHHTKYQIQIAHTLNCNMHFLYVE